MDPTARLISTSAKAGLLSTILFVIYLIIRESINVEVAFYVFFISYIITSILSLFFIVGSILPIVSLDKQRCLRVFYRRYFPYYMMLFFIGITAVSIYTEFDDFIMAICLIGFFTAAQSWTWLFKAKTP